jgi:hypothetical protein
MPRQARADRGCSGARRPSRAHAHARRPRPGRISMSTSTTTARPPYDPELEPALAASPLPQTVTLDMVGALRGAAFGPSVDDLLAGRPLDRQDVTFAGPDGDLTATVIRPRGTTGARPGIYFLHGGGMIIGDRFTGIDELLAWAEEHGAVAVTLEYPLAPEHPDPAPSRPPTPGCCGPSSTRPSWASTRTGCCSRQLGRCRHRGRRGAAGPRPRWSPGARPAAGQPHARRPRGQRLQPPVLAHRVLEPRRATTPAGTPCSATVAGRSR